MFYSALIAAVALVTLGSSVLGDIDFSMTTEVTESQVKSSDLFTDWNNMIETGTKTATPVNRMKEVQNTTKIDVIEKLKSIDIKTTTSEEAIATIISSKEVSKVLSQTDKSKLDELKIREANFLEEYKNITVSVDELPQTEQDIYDLNSEITKDL